MCNFQSWYTKEGWPSETLKKKKRFTLASEDFETIKVENDIENTAFKYKSFAGPPII